MKDIEGYKFKAEDETGFLKKLVANCQSFFNKKIDESKQDKDEVDLNMLAHYEVNQITGEKFLRLVIRQWKTSYDPEVNLQGRANRNKRAQKTDKNSQYEIHSLRFMKFDEELQ